MKGSFCTTCKGRLHHLEKTLPVNLADNADFPDAEFVVLAYGEKETYDFLKDKFPEEIKKGRLIAAYYPDGNGFNFPHAKNMAHRIAAEFGKFRDNADHVLCNVDADNFTRKGFAQYLSDYFGRKNSTFMCNSMFLRGDEILNGSAPIDMNAFRGTEGRLAIKKPDFYSVYGYDENRFKGWAPDDVQLAIRLKKKLGAEPQLIAMEFLGSIAHTDAERMKYSVSGEDAAQSASMLTKMTAGSIASGGYVENFLLHEPVRSGQEFGNGKALICSSEGEKEVELSSDINKRISPKSSGQIGR